MIAAALIERNIRVSPEDCDLAAELCHAGEEKHQQLRVQVERSLEFKDRIVCVPFTDWYALNEFTFGKNSRAPSLGNPKRIQSIEL
jgi:hypothetical protein